MTSWALDVTLPSSLLLCVMLFLFHLPRMYSKALISWNMSIFNEFEGSHHLLYPSLKVSPRNKESKGKMELFTKHQMMLGTEQDTRVYKMDQRLGWEVQNHKEHKPNTLMLVSMLSSGIWLHLQRKQEQNQLDSIKLKIFTAKGAVTKDKTKQKQPYWITEYLHITHLTKGYYPRSTYKELTTKQTIPWKYWRRARQTLSPKTTYKWPRGPWWAHCHWLSST